jgi:peptidoglycan/xylan/chitin deacetylase (PgdA/CDA1 family)
VLVLAAGSAIAVAVWALVDRASHSAVTVTIGTRKVRVVDGTTLGEFVSTLNLRPMAGSLVDVEGKVLRPGAFPGKLLLNGKASSPGTRLQTGDRIIVVGGRDRREPLSQEIVRVPEGMPSNPQFFLARTPGDQVVFRGAVSHKLVAARFRPSGDRLTVARAVALTFDDGPSPTYTPRILATLERLNVRATFFVVGYLADQYPGLVRREAEAGMAIGNHTYNHPEVPQFDRLPRRLITDEVALGNASLMRTGVRPMLFRPPGGSSSPAVVQVAKALGQRTVLWSVDPGDWRPGVRARQIVRQVLSSVRAGSIVILHDGGGDRTATVAALPSIVKGIRRKGLRLVAITPQ